MANNSLDSLAPLILNPLTPMAFLPPQFGFEFTLVKYVFVGTLGVSRAFTQILRNRRKFLRELIYPFVS